MVPRVRKNCRGGGRTAEGQGGRSGGRAAGSWGGCAGQHNEWQRAGGAGCGWGRQAGRRGAGAAASPAASRRPCSALAPAKSAHRQQALDKGEGQQDEACIHRHPHHPGRGVRRSILQREIGQPRADGRQAAQRGVEHGAEAGRLHRRALRARVRRRAGRLAAAVGGSGTVSWPAQQLNRAAGPTCASQSSSSSNATSSYSSRLDRRACTHTLSARRRRAPPLAAAAQARGAAAGVGSSVHRCLHPTRRPAGSGGCQGARWEPHLPLGAPAAGGAAGGSAAAT